MARATSLGIAAGFVLALGAGSASAGPCTDGIAAVGRVLSSDPSMGAATTGTVSGRTPDVVPPSRPADMTAGAPSLSPGGRTGGEGGVKEMNAASNQVATSAEDVRRQQQGLPTAAQDPGRAAALNDTMSAAKNKLAEAQTLDARGDAACAAPLNEAKRLSGS
jgi:hypothetical protein